MNIADSFLREQSYDSDADALDKAAVRFREQSARITELEEALRPFADMAKHYDMRAKTDGYPPPEDHYTAAAVFSFAQLRRARAVLNDPKAVKAERPSEAASDAGLYWAKPPQK